MLGHGGLLHSNVVFSHWVVLYICKYICVHSKCTFCVSVMMNEWIKNIPKKQQPLRTFYCRLWIQACVMLHSSDAFCSSDRIHGMHLCRTEKTWQTSDTGKGTDLYLCFSDHSNWKINPEDFLSCVVLDRSKHELLILWLWPTSKNNQIGKLPPKNMLA